MTVEHLPNRRLRISHTHTRADGESTTIEDVQAVAQIMDPDGAVDQLEVTHTIDGDTVTTVAHWDISADAKPWSYWYGVTVDGDLKASATEEIVVREWPFA